MIIADGKFTTSLMAKRLGKYAWTSIVIGACSVRLCRKRGLPVTDAGQSLGILNRKDRSHIARMIPCEREDVDEVIRRLLMEVDAISCSILRRLAGYALRAALFLPLPCYSCVGLWLERKQRMQISLDPWLFLSRWKRKLSFWTSK